MREVRGLGFDNAPRARMNGVPTIPLVVPFVDHRYGRAATSTSRWSRSRSMSWSIWRPARFMSPRARSWPHRFLIPQGATVIVSGVDKDGPIERWWELKERAVDPGRVEGARHRPRHHAQLQRADRCATHRQSPRDETHPVGLDGDGGGGLAGRACTSTAAHCTTMLAGATSSPSAPRSKFLPSSSRLAAAAANESTGTSRSSAHSPIGSAVRSRSSSAAAVASSANYGSHFAHVSLIETEAFSRTIRRRRAYLTEVGPAEMGEISDPEGRADRRSSRAQHRAGARLLRDVGEAGAAPTAAGAARPARNAP